MKDKTWDDGFYTGVIAALSEFTWKDWLLCLAATAATLWLALN